jgi:uncharacterized tellurite resistance protein B-like protein
MSDHASRLPITNRQKDLVRALACVMWADGHAHPLEQSLIEQIIDSLDPNDAERAEMLEWVREDVCVLGDVEIERLSAEEREVLLRDAVLLALADDVFLPSERAMLVKLSERLEVPVTVIDRIVETQRDEAAVSLPSSVLEERSGPTDPPPPA